MKTAAIGIIFSSDRTKVLLVKRRDVPIWVLPGGGIEENEDPKETVEREVFEETSLRVTVKRLVGQYLPINRLASETFVFECSCHLEYKTLSPQKETVAVGFFPLDTLPQPFFFLHQEWLNDALFNHSTPIICKMNSITWWAVIKNAMAHPLLMLRYLLSRIGLPLNSKTD